MGHGGNRPGAGRKKGIVAQAVARSTAADILAKLNDEECCEKDRTPKQLFHPVSGSFHIVLPLLNFRLKLLLPPSIIADKVAAFFLACGARLHRNPMGDR